MQNDPHLPSTRATTGHAVRLITALVVDRARDPVVPGGDMKGAISVVSPRLDKDVRMLMHPDDSRDTQQIARIKRLWWDCFNTWREYLDLLPSTRTLMQELEDLTIVLCQDAQERNLPPVNVTSPRTPLPREGDGRVQFAPLERITEQRDTRTVQRALTVAPEQVRWMR